MGLLTIGGRQEKELQRRLARVREAALDAHRAGGHSAHAHDPPHLPQVEAENERLRQAQQQAIACVSTLAGALQSQLGDLVELRDELIARPASPEPRAPAPHGAGGAGPSTPAREEGTHAHRAAAALTQRRTALYLSFLQSTVRILQQQVEESRDALAVANAVSRSASSRFEGAGAPGPPIGASSGSVGGRAAPAPEFSVAAPVDSDKVPLSSRGSNIALEMTLGNRSTVEHAPLPPQTPPPPPPPVEPPPDSPPVVPLGAPRRSSDAPKPAPLGDASSHSSNSMAGEDGGSRWFRRGLHGISGVANALTPRGTAQVRFARQAPSGRRRATINGPAVRM